MNCVDIAQRWRTQNVEHAYSGIVMIWAGQVYGWINCLRDAQHERPGVDVDENVFIAEGGNDYDGKCWVAHS